MRLATAETLNNDPQAFADRRASKRHTVQIEAILHARGKSQSILIDDISTGGVGVKRAVGLYANDRIEIEFAGKRRLTGKIAWWMSGNCGVQFDSALSETDPLLAAI